MIKCPACFGGIISRDGEPRLCQNCGSEVQLTLEELRCLAPTNGVLPTVPPPAFNRLLACLLRSLLPRNVSSTSTAPLSFPEPSQHESGCQLRDAEFFGQLQGRHTFAGCHELVNGVEPLVEGNVRPFEYRPDADSEFHPTGPAAVVVDSLAFARCFLIARIAVRASWSYRGRALRACRCHHPEDSTYGACRRCLLRQPL